MLSKSYLQCKTLAQQNQKSASVVPNVNANLEEQHLQELAQTVVELKLASIVEAEDQQQLFIRLNRRVRWLISSWLLSIFILSGAGAWIAFHLYTQQQQLTIQLPYLQTSKADSQQLEDLENRLQELNLLVSDNLQENQNQLEELQRQLEVLSQENASVASRLHQRQQAIAVLTKALEELLTEDATEVEIAASDQDDSQPTNLSPSLEVDNAN